MRQYPDSNEQIPLKDSKMTKENDGAETGT